MTTRSLALLAVLLLGLATLGFAQGQTVQVTKGPVVEHAGSNSAVIAWTTDVNAGTEVRYGTDPNKLDQRAQMPWGGLTHRVTLKNLEPGKTYYYQAVSAAAQGSGQQFQSDIKQFQTPPAGASQAGSSNSSPNNQSEENIKVVAGPIPQKVTENSAQIWWQTNDPSSTILKYGTDPNNLAQTKQHEWGQASHVAELSGLQPGTTYYYQVQAPNGRWLVAGKFNTLAAGQTEAFRITNGPWIEHVTDNSVQIAWSTDKPSSSVVKYGSDADSMNQTAQAPWGQTTHRVTIKNLQPNTRYWFAIESAQAQGTGQSAKTIPFAANTVAQGQQALNIQPR